VDATDAEAGNLLRLMKASDITIDFGGRKDRLSLGIADKFGSMELTRGIKSMLPQIIKVDPAALISFSNDELRARCLAYRGAT
jgi:hypothetical protein